MSDNSSKELLLKLKDSLEFRLETVKSEGKMYRKNEDGIWGSEEVVDGLVACNRARASEIELTLFKIERLLKGE